MDISKNDMVRLLPGPAGTTRLWRAPTQVELWRWVKESPESEVRAPRYVPEDVRPYDDMLLVVAETRRPAPEGFEGPKELCKILDLTSGRLWWVEPSQVEAL